MNIGNIIRAQRNKLSLSQEELGERIYITRQTISSWENGKSYPDINSLILLSQVFDMTIDKLVKGDLEMMEQTIQQADIQDMKRYRMIAKVSFALMVLLLPASWYLGSIPGIVIGMLMCAISVYFENKIKKIRCHYDVHTYREIVAFLKGEFLDETAKIRESGKRRYQEIFWTISSFFFGVIVSMITFWILF